METETNIIIDLDYEYDYGIQDEVRVINKIWCEECGHEFKAYDYDDDMIEEMSYCPFCGRKIKKVRYY